MLGQKNILLKVNKALLNELNNIFGINEVEALNKKLVDKRKYSR